MTDIRDLTLLNQPSRPFIRNWSSAELATLARWPLGDGSTENYWFQEDCELCHPCGDRLVIAEVGYVLWNEFGEFPDLPFMNLGQALIYIHNT